jgi:hypothetical protein
VLGGKVSLGGALAGAPPFFVLSPAWGGGVTGDEEEETTSDGYPGDGVDGVERFRVRPT